jgi:hypothetical protein
LRVHAHDKFIVAPSSESVVGKLDGKRRDERGGRGRRGLDHSRACRMLSQIMDDRDQQARQFPQNAKTGQNLKPRLFQQADFNQWEATQSPFRNGDLL